jgi:hypothetical protein
MINNQFNNQTSIDRDRVRQYVQDNLRKRQQIVKWVMFGANVLMFLIFNVLAWVVLFTGTRTQYGTVIETIDSVSYVASSAVIGMVVMLGIGWATGLFFHFLTNVVDTKAFSRPLMQRLTTEAINQQVFGDMLSEPEKQKRKRDQIAHLTDDGEIELIDAETEAQTRSRSNG